MNRQLIAIRDGKYKEAIALAQDRLADNPDDIRSHFTLAQAYEAVQEPEQALVHAERCAAALPGSFEAHSLAAKCAAEAKRYEDAYRYAEKALMDRGDPNLPLLVRGVLRALSYVPGLKGLRTANEVSVGAYAKETQWLHDYVVWYQGRSSSDSGYPTQ